MNRYKKKNKPRRDKPARTPLEIVKLSNYLNLAVNIRTLYMVYGWREKRISRFIESYMALVDEVADHRVGVNTFIEDTKELTGFDAREILDDTYNAAKR